MTDIDARIDADHRRAAAAEDDARAIVSRMAKIEGMDRFLASGRREHGQVPNPYRVGNLTAIGLLERHDPALASYLAAAAGKGKSAPDYARQEAEAERQQQIQRMQAATADLAASNANARLQRERSDLAGGNHITGHRRF
uniref:hypothetical protein n=1 Tax=Cyanobium sp. TaxID=2164130 RepID=UPI004047B672